jgi:hypothetical protein
MKSVRYSCPILMNLEFSMNFFPEIIWIFTKIHPAGDDQLFHADRRTDMTTLIVAFQNLANAPKNVSNAKSTPKLWQRCLTELTIAIMLTDSKTSVGTFISSFLSVLQIPITSCFLISSMRVLIKRAKIGSETYNLDQRTEFQTNRCSSRSSHT